MNAVDILRRSGLITMLANVGIDEPIHIEARIDGVKFDWSRHNKYIIRSKLSLLTSFSLHRFDINEPSWIKNYHHHVDGC